MVRLCLLVSFALCLILLAVVPLARADRGGAAQPEGVLPGDAAIAIVLACRMEHVPAGACQSFMTVAWCESRMNPHATNGQYKGLFQLSARHRSDPIIRLLGWRDAYAEALHTVRYVKRHGWSEWQCLPDGGLRW